jgi:hypothetical protein
VAGDLLEFLRFHLERLVFLLQKRVHVFFQSRDDFRNSVGAGRWQFPGLKRGELAGVDLIKVQVSLRVRQRPFHLAELALARRPVLIEPGKNRPLIDIGKPEAALRDREVMPAWMDEWADEIDAFWMRVIVDAEIIDRELMIRHEPLRDFVLPGRQPRAVFILAERD